jgi:sugar lactone lactonase YvrE
VTATPHADRALAGAPAAGLALIALLVSVRAVSAQAPPALRPGDLLVADGLLHDVGGILRVDPASGAQTVFAQGGDFVLPTGIAIAPTGEVYVADIDAAGGGGAIFRIDPATGARTLVSSNASPGTRPFEDPSSIAFDATGKLIVGDPGAQGGSGAVFRVDPATGAREVLSSGDRFVDPTGVVVLNGTVYVADGGGPRANPGRVLRVAGENTQFVVTAGGSLLEPFGLAAAPDGTLIVADTGALNDLGRVVGVNPATGAQTLLAQGGDVFEPFGVTVAPDGTIYFTDANPNENKAAVFRISATSGEVTRISVGGDLVLPLGVAVVAPEPASLGLVLPAALLLRRRR